MTERINILRNRHAGARCCIVGMGPTLLDLTAESFTASDVVVAMNHAIIHIEQLPLTIPVYSMQKDGFCVRPLKHPLIVHELEGVHEIGAENANSPDYAPRYLFNNPDDFGLEWYRPSVVTAVKIAELFGCRRLKLLACDALSTGDVRRVEFEPDGTTRIDEGSRGYTAPTHKLQELEESIPIEIDWSRPPEQDDPEPCDTSKPPTEETATQNSEY
jgi:hypothetical protein